MLKKKKKKVILWNKHLPELSILVLSKGMDLITFPCIANIIFNYPLVLKGQKPPNQLKSTIVWMMVKWPTEMSWYTQTNLKFRKKTGKLNQNKFYDNSNLSNAFNANLTNIQHFQMRQKIILIFLIFTRKLFKLTPRESFLM